MNKRIFPLAALVVAVLAACAGGPAPNSALEQARARVRSAQADTQIVSLAPQELKRADESLRMAEKTWADGGEPATVNHQAYMTGQRVTIAQETAASLADQATIASAAAERDKMRLAVRTNEADAAKQQLSEAQRVDARKTAELAAADAAAKAAAERNKARVESRDARVSDLEAQLAEMNAKKTDRGMVVTLGDVLFDSGKAALQPDGDRNIAKLADVFKQHPERTASIEGYTDSVGSAGSNRALSGRRAGAVMEALVRMGVPADHLTMVARGEDSPVASNDTASGRQMNRRVEIVFGPTAVQ